MDTGVLWSRLIRVDIKPYVYLAFGLSIAYIVVSAVYTIYFHPLSKFPGPKRAVVSNVIFPSQSATSLLNSADILLPRYSQRQQRQNRQRLAR